MSQGPESGAPSQEQAPSGEHAGRLEHLAPGIPVAAKAALLLGVAGGLFLAIVLSYANPDRQYAGLALGIGAGIAGALLLSIRNKRKRDHSG